MKDVHRITREDMTDLLRRTFDQGCLSVYVGLPYADRHDPGQWMSAVRSGLKKLGQGRGGDKYLVQLVQTAQSEISQLPLTTRHRSLVYFRSLQPDWLFWRSLQLHVPNLFAFESSPQVRHLVALLDESPVLGIAVISQERTRLFSWHQASIEELEELVLEPEAIEARVAQAGGMREAAVGLVRPAGDKDRTADQVRRHLSRVATRIAETGDARGWQKILLIGPSATCASVADDLPAAWGQRLIGAVDRNLIKAPRPEIVSVAEDHLHQWKRRAEVEEVERLIDESNSGGRASVGFEPCLVDLHERRVERLYVCGDLQQSGYRDGSGRLYLHAPRLGSHDEVVPERRLVERMVVSALESGATVIPLEGDSARRLSLLGGVGARLRWREPTNGS